MIKKIMLNMNGLLYCDIKPKYTLYLFSIFLSP